MVTEADAFKLTPLLIGGLTIAARRWGHTVGGWLVGLPLTSGPVSVFLALEQGAAFAQAAAVGTIAGVAAVAAFILAYARAAAKWKGAVPLGLGVAAFLAAAAVLSGLPVALPTAAVVAAAALLLARRLLPRPYANVPALRPPRWDVPARMAAATLMVFLLTTLAAELGAWLTGLLSPFPVFTAVLAVFTHRQVGPGATQELLRGVLAGLAGFIAFFAVLAPALGIFGLGASYTAAATAALVVNATTLRWVRPALPAGLTSP
jgi:uncharacterized membrane protein (GlpM family)